MAIAITEGCMDEVGNSTVCKHILTQNNALVRDEIVSTRESRETIPFHKHCQKTVCSAHGYDGQGMTKDILIPSIPGDLSNLQLFISQSDSPNTWQGYFTRNKDNITQDLRSILELMNKISGNVAKSWTLRFYDNNEHKICEQLIEPWTSTSNIYTLSGFGRDIELTVDGTYKFKFNTIKKFDENPEQLSIELEKKDLTVNFNGQLVGTVKNIYMEEESQLDIKQDFNLLPTSQYIDSAGGQIVDGRCRIYRCYDNSGGSITPTFVLDQKYKLLSGHSAPVVEWEMHLSNNNTSNNLIVNSPVVNVGDDNNYFSKYVALTDQMYVEPGKTNVYVFRAEMYSLAKVITYSLAYVY